MNTSKDIMNLTEAAEYLGLKPGYMYRLTAKERIKFTKKGKLIFFEKRDLDLFLIGRLVPVQSTIVDLESAAEIVGLSSNVLKKLSEQGLVPNFQRQGQLYYDKVELFQWLKTNN